MDLNLQSKLLYESSYENVQQAVLDSFKEKGWLLLYEGKKYPEGERAKYSNQRVRVIDFSNRNLELIKFYLLDGR